MCPTANLPRVPDTAEGRRTGVPKVKLDPGKTLFRDSELSRSW